MKAFRIFSSLLLAMLLAGCSQSSETSLNGGSVVWANPGAGTEFVYNLSGFSGTPPFDTIEISATDQQIGGKTNVTRILGILSGESPRPAGFYAIEANGDISLGDSGLTAPDSITWERYPTGSRQTISDTPIVTPVFAEIQTRKDIRYFIGPDTVAVTAGIFSTLHIQEIITTIGVDSRNAISDTAFETNDYWFAPSIGYFVKSTYTETSNGQITSLAGEDLIKFTPH